MEKTKTEKIEELSSMLGDAITYSMNHVPQNPHRDQFYFRIKEALYWAAEAINMGVPDADTPKDN